MSNKVLFLILLVLNLWKLTETFDLRTLNPGRLKPRSDSKATTLLLYGDKLKSCRMLPIQTQTSKQPSCYVWRTGVVALMMSFLFAKNKCETLSFSLASSFL